jgi:AcrR family transcriptional regulator
LKQPLKDNHAKLQRPRSLRAHDQVLDSAIKLFADNGIDGTSIDSIAAHSGVSKATIYKHWADKNALCLEALGRVHGLDREAPKFDSGDLKQDFIDLLNHRPPDDQSQIRDRLLPHLIAYGARNPEFGIAWRTRVMEPARKQAIALMDRGIAQGIFPAELDKVVGLALLLGPMLYKHIFRGPTPAPANLAEGVVHAFWRAFAVTSPKKRT